MDKNKILQDAHIPEVKWADSYVTDDGAVYVPEDGLTGKEVYQRTIQALAAQE